ncbi:electron transfer flavoprotein subunit alpha/FixB family protein [Thermosulfuriphilus sp.]
MPERPKVMILAETGQKGPRPVSYELATLARMLAFNLNAEVTAVLFGGPEVDPSPLFNYGVERIKLLRGHPFEHLRDDLFARILSRLVSQEAPEILLAGATSLGLSVLPRVAAELELGLTAHCTELKVRPEDRALLQIRPSFGEDVMAVITSKTKPQMATVRPGVFRASPLESPATGRIEEISWPEEDLFSGILEILSHVPLKPSRKSLREAQIVVAGGLGLKNKEAFSLIAELANLLGGALGATRPVVELGWVGPEAMVGVTGETISPRLYLAFGISGAVQHTVGLKGAEVIVAVNTDPQAPIFKIATYGLVADAREVLASLIRRIKEIKGEGS